MRRVPAIAISAVLLSACGGDTAPVPAQVADLGAILQSAPSPPGEAAIRVNGRTIPLGLIDRQVRAGRDKQVVVDELVNAELFYDRAMSMDYLADDAVREEHKRLMVQRLLQREVEERHPTAGIDASRVKGYYDANLHLYYTPELRAADHLLVKPSGARWDPQKNWDSVPKAVFQQCADWSARIHEDVVSRREKPTGAADLQAIADRWKPQLPADLEVIVESLPGSPKRAFGKPGEPGFMNAMVPSFSDAMFALARPGVLSEPVTTMFGTHLLVVTRIRPEDRVPLKTADAGIREYLATQDRVVASRALLTRLLGTAEIRADETKLAKLGASKDP